MVPRRARIATATPPTTQAEPASVRRVKVSPIAPAPISRATIGIRQLISDMVVAGSRRSSAGGGGARGPGAARGGAPPPPPPFRRPRAGPGGKGELQGVGGAPPPRGPPEPRRPPRKAPRPAGETDEPPRQRRAAQPL